MSETCGCASFSINDYNIPHTMGIPMPSMTYGLVDPETKKLIKFEDGQDEIEGELIISGPTVTPGILDGKVIVPHYKYDDMEFILTRDIAKMNRDGGMEFLERKDRSFTRFDGFKVKPYELENMLKQDSRIKYCVVSPYFDEEKMGNMIMATIVLNSNKELCDSEKCEFVNDIVNNYFIKNSNVSSRQIPTMFKFEEQLPQTKMAKIDYNAIINKGITGDEVEIVLEEANISISDIQILPPKNKKFKPLPFWREILLNDDALCEYYLKKRKYEYQNGTILKGLKWRDKLHPILLTLIRLNRKFIARQKLIILNDKRIETDKPVIYAITHVGVYDYQIVCEAIKEHQYPFAGDPETMYRSGDGLILYLNGLIYCDTNSKEDRKIALETSKQLLKNNENLLIYPEGIWNLSPNLLSLPLFAGIIT